MIFHIKKLLSKSSLISSKKAKTKLTAKTRGLAAQAMADNLDPFLRPDDVFLVSFPKSGNTWLRNIAAHLLYPHNRITSLEILNELIPDLSRESGIHFLKSEAAHSLSSPRVLKTHSSYPFRPGRGQVNSYNRVIYVVRHPFDVVRSYHYYFGRYNSDGYTLMDSLNKVIFQGNQWGTWQDNLLSWKALEAEKDFLLIRYEDLLADTAAKIVAVAHFLNREISPATAEAVREKCSMEAMRQLKTRKTATGENFEFVRRNEDTHRQIKEDLTPAMKKIIVEQCGYGMKLLDYSPD